MAGLTKVGPPEPGDRPRKRKGRVSRWLLFMNWRLWPLAGRVSEIEDRMDAAERKHVHTGIPEADLTEDQRDAAARRMQSEDAIRRARGK